MILELLFSFFDLIILIDIERGNKNTVHIRNFTLEFTVIVSVICLDCLNIKKPEKCICFSGKMYLVFRKSVSIFPERCI